MHRRLHLSSLAVLLLSLSGPTGVRAQTGQALTDSAGDRLTLTLWGGWTSFSQKSLNDVIRLDNFVLTAPADSGGAGLEKGIDPLTDAVGGGIEVAWALGPGRRLIAGIGRLQDGSRVDFLYDDDGDPGTPPVASFLDYRVGAWPIHAGLAWGFRLDDRLEYTLSASLLYFPSSDLRVRGAIGGPAALDEMGTASGLGAAFTWGGMVRMGGALRAGVRVGLRLGRLGDVKTSDGSPIVSAFGDELGLDWSGVDVQLGLTWALR